MQIHQLWQYPVKGFGGNQMPLAKLQQGGYFPNDRQFAISIGDEKTAAASDGTWFRKAHFLQLMSHESLAEYSCRYDDDAANPIGCVRANITFAGQEPGHATILN